MRILVTRPIEDALATKRVLESHGHSVVISPVIEIVHLDVQAADISDAQALIATSRNAIRAVAQSAAHNSAIALPLFVVGPGTAREAATAGFGDIRESGNTSRDMLPVITQELEAGNGPVVHLAGDKLAFDIAGALEQNGYNARVHRVYETRAACSLSPEAITALRDLTIDAVILMSPRSAKTWAECVDATGLKERARQLNHLCLSNAVAAQLTSLEDVNIDVAKRPNSEEMLALVNRLAAQSG